MAFVVVWSGINFSGTGDVLSVGPIDLGTSPLTVNSVEVAPYYCITVFDGANYTGNFKTYFSNNVDTSSFSLIKSIIVQDCFVPYHNDYNKSVVSANDYQTYVALNRYINLQEDATEYDTAFYYLQKNQTDYKIGYNDFQSIVIQPGYYATFFDGNQRSITFYNSVYFLDAFKDLESNPFSSASYLQYMKIFMKNPPCSVTDPCPTCPTCPTCKTCETCQTCPTCPTCKTCETCEKPTPCATCPTCKKTCSDIFDSMTVFYIVLGVFCSSVLFLILFYFIKNRKNSYTPSKPTISNYYEF